MTFTLGLSRAFFPTIKRNIDAVLVPTSRHYEHVVYLWNRVYKGIMCSRSILLITDN